MTGTPRLSVADYRRRMGLPPVEPAPMWRGTGGTRCQAMPLVQSPPRDGDKLPVVSSSPAKPRDFLQPAAAHRTAGHQGAAADQVKACRAGRGGVKAKQPQGGQLSLAALIQPPALSRQLKPEEALSHGVARMLADMADAGRLRALPVCASTERNGRGARAIVGRLVKRLMGAWPGQPDWIFVGERFGVLELKRPRSGGSSAGSLSAEQRTCRTVCLSLGIPHAVARTVEEARRALEEMGVIEGAA